MTFSMTFKWQPNPYLLYKFYTIPASTQLEAGKVKWHLAQQYGPVPAHVTLYQSVYCTVMHIYAQHVIENIPL